MNCSRTMAVLAGMFLMTPVSLADVFDIQAAIDEHAGGVITVPAGEHRIRQPLEIRGDNTVLEGHGTIVQENPAAYVLLIEEARDVRVSGLTFTRAAGAAVAEVGGLRLIHVDGAVLDNVRLIDCKSREAALIVEDSKNIVVRDSEIRNYKCITIDDRTDNPLCGYAFHAIDGHGLRVARCENVLISRNRIVERELLPTRAIREAHGLGQLTEGREPTNPGRLGESAVAAGYVSHWHQGSAILVTGPRETRHVQVLDNHIVNAAQGIDLHCDHTLVSGNLIDHCMIGLKATHGCEGLTLVGNTITHVDLWGIVLNPGALSAEDNPDRAILIANNTILAYGHGHEYWNWGGGSEDAGSSYAIALFDGQLAENPPLREVLISGNVVGGNPGPPRYRYAVAIRSWWGTAEDSPNMPDAPQFQGNLFTPGREGVSNVPLSNVAPTPP